MLVFVLAGFGICVTTHKPVADNNNNNIGARRIAATKRNGDDCELANSP